MKAFEVKFQVGGASGLSETILVKDENEVELALENKTGGRFDPKSSYAKITSKKEVSLSKVKIGELSITEFLSLKNL